jgi:2,3-bisphosphoglycerate-dependent phosphoglycerate mutase
MTVGNDSKYNFLPKNLCPRTESLKTTLERVIPFWETSIAPRVKSGEKIIIVAHGNSVCFIYLLNFHYLNL